MKCRVISARMMLIIPVSVKIMFMLYVMLLELDEHKTAFAWSTVPGFILYKLNL